MEPETPQNQPPQPLDPPNQPRAYPPVQSPPTPTVQQPQPPQFQQQVDPTAVPKKAKPPVAAQILYALGFVGLIVGLFLVVLTILSANNSDSAALYSAFGLGGLSGQAGAIVMGLIVIALFYLIHEIRRLKKWALIAYTTLVSFGLALTIYEELTKNPFEKLFDRSNPIADFLVFIFVAPLLIILWTKNRRDFS